MRTGTALQWALYTAMTIATAVAEPVHDGGACERCRKVLGVEVQESSLSGDPDFKREGMFQVCQPCLDRRMGARDQRQYVSTALKYKWNSIAHNQAKHAFRSPFARGSSRGAAHRRLRGV